MPTPGLGDASHRPVNVISAAEQSTVLWNGTRVTEAQLRTYLGLVKSMPAGNLTVLAADPRADCAFADRIRRMINDVLSCTEESCGEVPPDNISAVPAYVRPGVSDVPRG